MMKKNGKKAEHYPIEDRAMKEAARFMGKELLPLMGVEGTVKGPAPTEAVYLEVSDSLADFNYEMEDGTWKHLEFESDGISDEDLRRFRVYEALMSYKYHVEVTTYVVCSSRVKRLKCRLKEGINTYHVKVIRMKGYSADNILGELEKKQKTEELKRTELLEVLLTPLMGGRMSQVKRMEKSLGILQNEAKRLTQADLMQMQSVLFALSIKFLTKTEIQKVKEMMSMSLLGQLLVEDGMEKGIDRGITIYKTLLETESVRKAAEALNEPVEKVRDIAVRYQVKVWD